MKKILALGGVVAVPAWLLLALPQVPKIALILFFMSQFNVPITFLQALLIGLGALAGAASGGGSPVGPGIGLL